MPVNNLLLVVFVSFVKVYFVVGANDACLGSGIRIKQPFSANRIGDLLQAFKNLLTSNYPAIISLAIIVSNSLAFSFSFHQKEPNNAILLNFYTLFSNNVLFLIIFPTTLFQEVVLVHIMLNLFYMVFSMIKLF